MDVVKFLYDVTRLGSCCSLLTAPIANKTKQLSKDVQVGKKILA